MRPRQTPLPAIWLVSDARNDTGLERALMRLPCGSGLIFRHYHLDPAARRARFDGLRRIARQRGHAVVLAGSPRQARAWGADGAYGAPRLLAGGPALLRLATVHSLREMRQCSRTDALLLSPVFPTRSHPGSATLGIVRFRLLAGRSRVPVIALGGMGQLAAQRLRWTRWAAIDSFIA